ncbi:electron transfer flavoprotein subunit beta [Bacillus sp. HMSC76G11]|nr:electron transfer flavoprotein subunit beta [Bacillus sp. HMSC76G11]
MNIYVVMKRTFDTEEKIVMKNGVIEEFEAKYVINPYDEYAIEEAILLKEKHGGEITVVTVGGEDAEKELRTALAMGADKAVLVNSDDDLEDGDEYTTAKVLSHFFIKNEFDIILGGNVAIDGGSGQVGPRLAALLDISYVTAITKIEINDQAVKIERDVEGDMEVIETSLPLLVTTQQGLNEPRYPSLSGIMKAKKKPLLEVGLDDLDLDEENAAAKTKVSEIYLMPKKEAGKILKGEVNDQVIELLNLLKTEAKVI